MTKSMLSALPCGIFRIKFAGYAIATRFGRGSLELRFLIQDLGPHVCKEISRYYKVIRIGKRSFMASRHSAFAREFVTIFLRRPPAGIHALQFYKDKIIEADVEIVTRGHDQKIIPEAARYSVVRQMLRKLDS